MQTKLFETLDFGPLHEHENNAESRQILHEQKDRLQRQAYEVLGLLFKGEKLTVIDAAVFHKIGDLRARIRDLKKFGIEIEEEKRKGGSKIWWIDNEYFIE